MISHVTAEEQQSPPALTQPPRFSWRSYQREDLARAAMNDGAIIAWDPGLGKTMAIFAFPILKRARRVIIVAPAALHQQIIEEGLAKFGVTVRIIDSQETAMRYMREGLLPLPGAVDTSPPPAIPSYFITAYNWLGYEGGDEWPADPEAPLDSKILTRRRQLIAAIDGPPSPDRLSAIESGIGTVHHGIRCVFTPTLVSLIASVFDCAVCDEAVRLKAGSETFQAAGVLRLEARYRLALTGTPIKNKLPDLFFLASFVTGHHPAATARWPYGNTAKDQAQFAADFGVIEENLTKREASIRAGQPRRFTKVTARICNLHRLWRILGRLIIRRRKDDVPGCDIVGKTIVPVRVAPGTHQQAAYRQALDTPPAHKNKLAALGAQLQSLRQVSLFPASSTLGTARSPHTFTPKSACILQLATDLMAKGEQLVIFSPFQEFSADLASRFTAAGVPFLNLDGKISPVKRGKMVKDFKSGAFPILIAGIASMGEGHSLDNCSHLVLPSLSWAFDENTQAIDRVHRLTSRKDVTIYVMVTRNTIDERLTSLWQEKGDSSDLALDGRLTDQHREEIDLASLLRESVAGFDPSAATVDEEEIAASWDARLAPALSASFATYRRLRPLPASTGDRPARSRRRVQKSPEIPTSESQPPPVKPPATFQNSPKVLPFSRMKTPPPTPSPQPMPQTCPTSVFAFVAARRQALPSLTTPPSSPPGPPAATGRQPLPAFRS